MGHEASEMPSEVTFNLGWVPDPSEMPMEAVVKSFLKPNQAIPVDRHPSLFAF